MVRKTINSAGFIIKVSALASAGFAGFWAGQKFEQNRYLCNKNDGKVKNDNILSKYNIKKLPGLPIFGNVSAASPIIPNEDHPEMGAKISMSTSRVGQIMKYGFPGFESIRSFDDFVLSYDRRNRVAHWVFEHLSKDKLQSGENVNRSACEFKPDESIHPFFRSNNSDFKGSGYDRGHLAAAGNHKSCQKHIEQTFFLSNMAPQVGVGFNRHSWNRLEKYVRGLTKIYNDVYVCTGPLYLPKKDNDGKKYVKYEVIGSNHVAVPTHFYKIIVGETKDSKYEMEAYVMPNAPIDDNTSLKSFQVPPESIERAAGLLFFDKLARNQLTKINGKNIK